VQGPPQITVAWFLLEEEKKNVVIIIIIITLQPFFLGMTENNKEKNKFALSTSKLTVIK